MKRGGRKVRTLVKLLVKHQAGVLVERQVERQVLGRTGCRVRDRMLDSMTSMVWEGLNEKG